MIKKEFTGPSPIRIDCLEQLPDDSKIPRSCHFAEYYFAKNVQDLKNAPSTTIFVDPGNNPVLLRKGYGQPTSLSLEDIELPGKTLPRGSIVYAITANERLVGQQGDQKQGITTVLNIGSYSVNMFFRSVRVLPITDLFAIEFARASDFGLDTPSLELVEMLDEIYDRKPEARDLIARTTIKSIKLACSELPI